MASLQRGPGCASVALSSRARRCPTTHPLHARSHFVSDKPKPSAVVFAKDVAKVATFYAELISMSIVHTDPDHIVLDSDAMQLVIHAIPVAVADSISITEPPEVREGMPIKLCLPVASIATARDKAAQLGGNVYLAQDEWQGRNFRACDGYDPEGNVVQFREGLR
jgi:predicted enzyme related to lactoylglutathione lyase